MSRYLLFFCILTTLATTTFSLSILFVTTMASRSHHVWSVPIVKELVRKGHRVHYAGFYDVDVENEKKGNFTTSIFENVMTKLAADEGFVPADWTKLNTMQVAYVTYELSHIMCNMMITTRGAQELLELVKNEKFDVIVQDVTLLQCLYGLWEVAKGNPPIVGYIPFALCPWAKNMFGGSNYPAVRPYVHSDLTPPFNIWQKTINLFYYIADDLIRYFYDLPNAQIEAERYLGTKLRPLAEIERKIDVLLINSHHSFEPSIPFPPNVIEIGGLHAQSNEPLKDEKIKEFLNGAEHGAIVISLGTNVVWGDIEVEKLNAVVTALSKIKQRVLWKLDSKVPIKLSKNVMATKWLPQNAVLQHKNVKAIWTHCGLLSTQEAIWHGVPIIGMPFFMDQWPNVKLLSAKGAGLQLDFQNLSMNSVLWAVHEIIDNPSYAQNMKQLSKEFRDRPMPPLDLAVWYIEYAGRSIAGKFGSPARYLSWVESSLLDVYAFLSVLIVVAMIGCFCVFCFAFKLLRHLRLISFKQKKA